MVAQRSARSTGIEQRDDLGCDDAHALGVGRHPGKKGQVLELEVGVGQVVLALVDKVETQRPGLPDVL